MKRPDHITAFVSTIWSWYARHKRDLPWRDLDIKDDTQRAYQVMVSEIMLQQTQVSRVIVIYLRFLNQFPTVSDLARTSNKEVILAWQGMGYNSRALRLRDAAAHIDQLGKFPTDMKELQAIPGIGHYTAAAIRNFAFNLPTACLDTNIRRILHRAFIGPENSDGTWKKNDKYLLDLAEQVLGIATKHGSTADWHAALMDYGSLVCTSRNPQWDICPLTKAGLMKAAYKVKAPKKARTKKQEPGRLVGSTYIPNRIFRGRIVQELRTEPAGLTASRLGPQICLDWSPTEHKKWLNELLEKLEADQLIMKQGKKYVLAE